MKKILALASSFVLFISITVQAQNIVASDFGDGLSFPINEPASYDLNNDGTPDILINQTPDKLSFTPIFLKGCFYANNQYPVPASGAQILVVEEGSNISSMNYFEDEAPLPLYGTDENIVVDMENGVAKYIGFLVFDSMLEPSVGWMKIRLDVDTETLYIMSYAYSSGVNITAGEGVAKPLDVPEIKSINDVSIFPNPVSNQLNIEVELVEASSVEFLLKSMNGQQVRSQVLDLNAGVHQAAIDVNDLANGIYQLTIQSNGEFISRSVTIGR